MEKRSLGKSGIQATVVGLGCNNFGMKIDLDATRAVLHAALDAGITFFDTADMYGNTQSEDFIGQILGPRRKDVVIATKFGGIAWMSKKGERWGTKEYISPCLEKSLQRLRTDYVDLYQLHFPDPHTPLSETLTALSDLVRQGKVRAIGCSNLSGAQIDEAAAFADANGCAHFVTAQHEWSLLNRKVEQDVIPACERHQLGQLPYFPLASGFLTGKYRRGQDLLPGSRLATLGHFKGLANEENFTKAEALEEFANKQGHSLLELAISWLAAQPSVASVIAGATTPEQVRLNATAANWRLEATELATVDRLVPAPA